MLSYISVDLVCPILLQGPTVLQSLASTTNKHTWTSWSQS